MEFTSITKTDSVCCTSAMTNRPKSERARIESHEEQRLYYVALTRAKARLYLPLVPDKLGGKQWDGGYRRLNERLTAITSNLEGSSQRDRFRIVPFHDRPARSRAASDGDRPVNDLASWQGKDVLEEKKPPSLPNFYQLKQDHAGYVVSSYSRMKRIESGELDPLERDEFRREPGQKTLATVLADDELPGGTATGTMLHEILENDPVRFAGREAYSGRLAGARRRSRRSFDMAIARGGITMTAGQRRRAGEMIYRALTTSIPLGSAQPIPGLHECKNVISEMEFLFPFPEDIHPLLSDPRPGKLVIERGYIKGFVDLVVEHEGRVYFADWKSDVLPSYEPDRIKAARRQITMTRRSSCTRSRS